MSVNAVTKFIIFIATAIILTLMIKSILSSKAVPTLGEFVASSTALSEGAKFIGEFFEGGTISGSSTPISLNSKFVTIKAPNGVIKAGVATSSEDQEKGLGDRESMPRNEGLLFVFARAGSYGFWMKDMHFPLDMIWIDAQKKVVGVTPNIRSESYPESYFPDSPVLYVLELNAGVAEEMKIVVGTKLEF